MPEQRDWHAYLAKQEERKRAEQQRERLVTWPKVQDVSYKAQQVIDHPGWQWFADQLETRVQAVKQQRQQYATRMIEGSELGAQLELLKLNVNKCDAELAGLTYAATCIPQAVAVGQRIAGEMSGQAAAAGADNQRVV